MDLYSWILTFGIISGQLIKIQLFNQSGPILLDFIVLAMNVVGISKLKNKFFVLPLYFKIAFAFIAVAVISLIFTPLNLLPKEVLASFLYTLRFSNFIFLGALLYSNYFPVISKNIQNILLVSGVSLSALGLLQLAFIPNLGFLAKEGWDPYVFRTVSTFLDPNLVGAFFCLTLVILAQKWLAYPTQKKIIFLMMIVYFALMTTFSRGSYLMFSTSFFVLTVLNKSLKLGILTIILCAGLYLGYSLYLNAPKEQRLSMKAASAQTRLDSWQLGWKLFTSYPVLGIGHNAYRFGLREINSVPVENIVNRGASSNHSSLLQVAATTGIAGLAVFAGFLGSIFQAGWKSHSKKDSWGIVLLSSTSGLIIHSFFANSLFYPLIFIWLILALAKLKNQ